MNTINLVPFTKGAIQTCDKFSLVASFNTLKYNTYHELCGNLQYIYSWTMQ